MRIGRRHWVPFLSCHLMQPPRMWLLALQEGSSVWPEFCGDERDEVWEFADREGRCTLPSLSIQKTHALSGAGAQAKERWDQAYLQAQTPSFPKKQPP